MHFHDLRHTHKTWLIEDGIPRSPKPAASATVCLVYGYLQPRHRAKDRPVVDALQRQWETTQPDGASDTVRRLRVVA
ncbi:hypothetical protein ACFW0V_19885 [Micromonospora parva]|uniref:hypothetical protein n=1 Tax=Micromonospora parva TaxID=1464048 RepID=UPI00366DF943